MIQRFALAALFLSCMLVAGAYATAFLPGGAPRWAAGLMIAGTAASLASAMALGAQREGRLGALALPILLVFVILVAGFAAMLLLPAESAATPLWLGLPPRAAIVLYGLGLLPLFIPVAYALSFGSHTLDEDDLERVRQAARQQAASQSSPTASASQAVEGEPVSGGGGQ